MSGGITEISLAIVCPPRPVGQWTDVSNFPQLKSRTLAVRTPPFASHLGRSPPPLFPAGQSVTFTSEQNMRRTFACIGYASRPKQAIDGARTFTSLDSQPCRLLPLALRYGSIRLSKGLSRSEEHTSELQSLSHL